MDLDPLLLARIQFAFTIAFHIIFPTFTIGLSAYIATLEIMWLKTGVARYHLLSRFWTKIFAVSFAMGVVSGVVMVYQFGANWSRFSVVTGNIVAPLAAYEVLTAFFLEATFLGVMLFGWNRTPPWLHVMASVFVALGTALSAFWILAANSWMQTPAGHEIKDGVAIPVDWIAVIFNPSFPFRFVHMLTAAYLTTAVVVLAVGARYLLAGRHVEEARTMLRMGVGFVAIVAPLQVLFGDLHGLNTARYQPTKVAALEGHWDGSKPGDFTIVGWPNEKTERNDYALSIPKAGSLLITRDPNGLYPGLKNVAPADRPPVPLVFFAFRLMLLLGLCMVAIGWIGAWLWRNGRLFETRWWLTPAAHFWWAGFVAVLSGWIVTESGRQPWLVQGFLRTAEAISPVPGASVASSLALFVVVYGVIFSAGIYYINRLIAAGPQTPQAPLPAGVTPLRPISAAGGKPGRAGR